MEIAPTESRFRRISRLIATLIALWIGVCLGSTGVYAATAVPAFERFDIGALDRAECTAIRVAPGQSSLPLRLRLTAWNSLHAGQDYFDDGVSIIYRHTPAGISATVVFLDDWGVVHAELADAASLQVAPSGANQRMCIASAKGSALVCGDGPAQRPQSRDEVVQQITVTGLAYDDHWRVSLGPCSDPVDIVAQSQRTRNLHDYVFAVIPVVLALVLLRLPVAAGLRVIATLTAASALCVFGLRHPGIDMWFGGGLLLFLVSLASILLLYSCIVLLVERFVLQRGPIQAATFGNLAYAVVSLLWLSAWPLPLTTEGGAIAAPTSRWDQLWSSSFMSHPQLADNAMSTRDTRSNRNNLPLSQSLGAPSQWAIVGPSVIYGREVSSSQTLTAVAQQRLQAVSRPTSLLNFGIEGGTLAQSSRALRRGFDHVALEGIAITSLYNDLVFPGASDVNDGCNRSYLTKTYCNLYFNPLMFTQYKALLPFIHLRWYLLDIEASYLAELRSMITHQQSLGRAVILIDTVSRDEVLDGEDEYYFAVTQLRKSRAALADELNVPVYSFHEEFRALGAEAAYYNEGIGHLSVQGHQLYGRLLADAILQNVP